MVGSYEKVNMNQIMKYLSFLNVPNVIYGKNVSSVVIVFKLLLPYQVIEERHVEIVRPIKYRVVSGCDSVGRLVASDPEVRGSKPVIGELFYRTIIYFLPTVTKN